VINSGFRAATNVVILFNYKNSIEAGFFPFQTMNLGYQSIYEQKISLFYATKNERKKRILKKSKIFGNFYPKSISFLVSSRKKKEIYERRRNVIN